VIILPRSKPLRWILLLCAFLAAGLAVRETIERLLSACLTVNDPVQPADVAIATGETFLPCELELADLYGAHIVPRVALLVPRPSRALEEFERRNILIETPSQRLNRLGVSSSAISLIPADEGGTTEGTLAVARWCLANGVHRVLMVTSASHSRRLRRAIGRAFDHRGPVILMHAPRFDSFRAEDWWRNRSTLRVGIPEFQKLLIDYLSHPDWR